MSIGRSHARLVSEKSTGVTFEDVAGSDKAWYELQEEVDFLKNPQQYPALAPKAGVILLAATDCPEIPERALLRPE